MKRAISTLGCPDLTLEDTLAMATAHGLDGVELRSVAGRLDLPAYFAGTYGSPAELARKLQLHAGARVLALSTGLQLAHATPQAREEFLAFVPWAEALGVPWLRVFDGGRPGEVGDLLEALRWWRSERAQHGWRCDVMIETHDALFTGEAIRRLGEQVPGAAILWDAFNTWLKGGEDPFATWQVIRSQVVHVHVKDALRVPHGDFPWTYVLPGRGEFPFRELVATLRAERFGGHVSLEWEKRWHPYLGPLSGAIAAAEACGWTR